MRAVMVQADEAYLAERRRLGHDYFDEMWEGVLHMNPPPSSGHQRLNSRLFLVLGPVAHSAGLDAWTETGLFRPGDPKDYRVPDQLYALSELTSDAGVEGAAAIVVEIRSPHDESYEKLPFYGALGVAEVAIIDPDDRRVELFRFADGEPLLVEPDPGRGVGLTALGVWLRTVETPDGPRLEVTWDGGDVSL